jgi:tRNA pseudouridine38-40 synthase
MITDPGEAPEPAGTRLKLTLHYDGSAFHGWQLQPDQRTVQGEVEAVLSRLFASPVRVAAAGRTDRGVHATGQVISFDAPARWTAERVHKAANALLPDDVWIEHATVAPPRFHARFDASSRSYRYRVGLTPSARSPFHARWCWWVRREIDTAVLHRCAAQLPGDHSFLSFAKAGQEERGDRCVVLAAGWREAESGWLEFSVTANRFLHHMVRYLVGTMVEIAAGLRDAGDFPRLLAAEPELETSPPAPPQGLFLTGVGYPPAVTT